MPKKNFTIEDLECWQQQGLISEEQLKSILAQEDLEAEPEAKERKAGLNPVTVAYYFGGFLALCSFAAFVGASWNELSDWALLGLVLVAMLVVGALGFWLRFQRGYPIAGGLLLFIATAILPLFIIAVERLLGGWNSGDSFYDLRFFILGLGLGGLAGALAVLYFSRFSLISLLVAALAHLTILDIAQIIGGTGDYALEVTAATCGGIILLGIVLTLWGKKFHAFWFKLYGLVVLYIALVALFFESESVLFGLLFLAVYLVLIGLSLRFREVIYLVFGAIGFYTYIIRIVVDTFEGTAVPLLLGGVGVSIILVAVLYQRYGRHLFRRGS
jgi:hypothetical protein